MTDSPSGNDARPAVLGLWDAVSIIIGIVVGTSIFEMPPKIARNADSAGEYILLWIAGGALSLVGAFCFAEMVTAYPRSGGSYVYLSRAWGRFAGFQYGWGNMAGILSANIGAMAFVFAKYASHLSHGPQVKSVEREEVVLALGAVLVLTVMNAVGVVAGKRVQNLLTGAKVLGLVAIIVAGLMHGSGASLGAERPLPELGPSLALILILYAYGGWSDSAFVAAEVRDVKRNLPRALILGISGITAIYVLANVGYLLGLGFEGLRTSDTPAADVLTRLVGTGGKRAMYVIVIASSLGALNGLVFTGSRVNAVLGADHPLFRGLGRWDPRTETPLLALATQALIACAMILVIGTNEGRSTIDRALTAIGLTPIPWADYGGGFITLVVGMAPVYWLFLLLTGAALFQLRRIDPDIERPYRVPFYPVTPMIFCLTCAWMLKSSLEYAKWLSLIGLGPLALGLPAYLLSESRREETA